MDRQWWSWSETLIYVRFELQFGTQLRGIVDFLASPVRNRGLATVVERSLIDVVGICYRWARNAGISPDCSTD